MLSFLVILISIFISNASTNEVNNIDSKNYNSTKIGKWLIVFGSKFCDFTKNFEPIFNQVAEHLNDDTINFGYIDCETTPCNGINNYPVLSYMNNDLETEVENIRDLNFFEIKEWLCNEKKHCQSAKGQNAGRSRQYSGRPARSQFRFAYSRRQMSGDGGGSGGGENDCAKEVSQDAGCGEGVSDKKSNMFYKFRSQTMRSIRYFASQSRNYQRYYRY